MHRLTRYKASKRTLTFNQPSRADEKHDQLQELGPQKCLEPSPHLHIAVVSEHRGDKWVTDDGESLFGEGTDDFWEEGEDGPLGDLEVAEYGDGDVDLVGRCEWYIEVRMHEGTHNEEDDIEEIERTRCERACAGA